MTLLYSLTIIGVMYYLVNRWSQKRIKQLDESFPKAYRVYKEKSETEKEIDRLLDFHEKAIS